MESIFDDLQQEYIVPQNFSFAISIAILCVILSYLSCFLDDAAVIIYLLENLLWIYLQFFFRTYLRNFRNKKAISWQNWNILAEILQVSVVLVVASLPRLVATHIITDLSPQVKMLVAVVFCICVTFLLATSIGLGIVLQKIKNDFVGLLHALGIIFTYLVPVAIALSLIFQFSKDARNLFSFYRRLPDIISTTINIIPIIVLILIFYRAMKHKEKDFASIHTS